MSFKMSNKGVFFVAVSQFGMAFSFSCIWAFMPFYIFRISTFGHKETMLWTGMIMGGTQIIAAFTAPFWGGLTSRLRPKLLYEWGLLTNGILIVLTGFTNSLYVILMLRILQGGLGGASTTGLILVSRQSPKERLHQDISLFQNSMTAGQLMGPPLGSFAASSLGYRAPFLFAFFIILFFFVFCHLYVTDIPPQKQEASPDREQRRGIFFGWSLILIAAIHMTFLPSILPTILEGFQLKGNAALRAAGTIIMAYTATSILGNFLLSRLASRKGAVKVITMASLCAALFQIMLILSAGVFSFTLIRLMQTGFTAAVFALTISIFARNVGGRTIGFLNSARFVGSAIGPLMATSVLAYANLLTLYSIIAGLTLAALWAFLTSIRTKSPTFPNLLLF